MEASIYVEEWAASYGSPYVVDPEAPIDEDRARPAEAAGPDLDARVPNAPPVDSLAFVDGVRRGDANLFLVDPGSGQTARGLVGALAVGAVLIEPERAPEFAEPRIERWAIWGAGVTPVELPSRGGWTWGAVSTADPHPDAPLRELQRRMRRAERAYALALAKSGTLVVVDGPLSTNHATPGLLGFVKTHHVALLPPAVHARLPELEAGARTALFALGDRVYSAYLRLAPRDRHTSPWAGIVRLELPQTLGLEAAVRAADAAATTLPRFAGVPHRDPRAPQNLQPIGALERHLRHLLGDAGLAVRAVRDAVASLHEPKGDPSR
jgi:hypothetical protein